VLAMSPIGTGFRNKLRMFPSLVNACTIDWFTEWPEDALEKVATNFLEEMEMTDDVRKRCVIMCQHFHKSVKRMSARYGLNCVQCRKSLQKVIFILLY
jgi:dynein heavy chain